MLLTRPPKVEGASLTQKKEHRRKLSGGQELLKAFLHVHDSCGKFENTPRRYIAFLHTYQQVYSKKKEKIEQKQLHLQVKYKLKNASLF